MFIYLTMLACAAAMALLVYRYDLLEKERWYMVALAVGLGFMVMAAAGAIENVLLGPMNLDRGALMGKVCIVAVVENLLKLLAVLSIAILFRRHCTNTLDGVIYGTLVGLGAAVEESLFYLSLSPATLLTLGTEIVRLFAHSLLGGVLGFAVGVFLVPARRRPILAMACAMVAILIHFSWDIIAYQAEPIPGTRGVAMLLMFSLMMLWGSMVAFASTRPVAEFLAERAVGRPNPQ